MINQPSDIPGSTIGEMMPPFVECLGYVAASLTTVSFLPQAWHTLRTRDVSGISLAMYASFTLGIALWLAYGIVASDKPIIMANAVTLVFSGSILFMKVREDARRIGRGIGESVLRITYRRLRDRPR